MHQGKEAELTKGRNQEWTKLKTEPKIILESHANHNDPLVMGKYGQNDTGEGIRIKKKLSVLNPVLHTVAIVN
jgi:hypothetical protein